ncbi:AraC family transcriptional regulator [Bacteroides sp.]|uniref:helix-turn-helix domain-containing protein n=1 Tax=Bacteroides sp. TaxID=29523 RepID=UPI002584604F|nr:AraC family transcriptional regulator [Bacteroides sp.]
MDVSIYEVMKSCGVTAGNTCCCDFDRHFGSYAGIIFEKGFFFLLVINGTATLSDSYVNYSLCRGDLVILTPSITSSIYNFDTDFSLRIVYIVPSYFDSLPDGQPLYNQVSRYLGNYRLSVFKIESNRFSYLKQTMLLFGDRLNIMNVYHDGIIRNLCNFFLLQIADALCTENNDTTVYVKRENEIFRNFKKLLVENYRKHHSIGFYADSLNITTTYLSRVVKSVTGNTVCFYISKMLFSDARRMLECTDMDIKEIANTLGFSDQSVFGKFFMRKTGLSPLNFRKKNDLQRRDK